MKDRYPDFAKLSRGCLDSSKLQSGGGGKHSDFASENRKVFTPCLF